LHPLHWLSDTSTLIKVSNGLVTVDEKKTQILIRINDQWLI